MKSGFIHSLGCLCLATAAAIGQIPDQEVVLKAMQDELNRNLSELKAVNFDKPFFIMYGMREQKSTMVSATLGSILQTTDHNRRLRTTTRVLVGDYGLNDESLEDDLTSSPTAMDLPLPVGDDYNGIRRSYWSITDNVYREAARHYKQHQEALKELGKPLKDVPHREFAKSQPVRIIGNLVPLNLDRPTWEKRLRTLSARFLKEPAINNSLVLLNFAQGYDYLVSSEGSVIKVPFQHCTYSVIMQGKDSQGAPTFEQIVHSTHTPDQLPAEAQLAAEIDQALSTMNNRSGPTLPEAYSGPALFLGPAVANVLARGALGREGLMASDYIPTSKGFQFGEESNTLDSKIGRNILHESLTIKARPHLKSFEGVELLGSFEVDNEGIVPPDELVLVDKGVLKNLMNNRTITHPTQTANGFGEGPGVLDVSTTFKDTEAVLKEKLVAQAKKEGLDFALIVRGSPLMGMGPMSVYKVNVADGKEELVRNAILSERNSRMLKRILGASATRAAYNLGGGEQAFQELGGGTATSCIVPTALLLEEVEIQSFRMPWQKETEFVPSPIAGK